MSILNIDRYFSMDKVWNNVFSNSMLLDKCGITLCSYKSDIFVRCKYFVNFVDRLIVSNTLWDNFDRTPVPLFDPRLPDIAPVLCL